MPWKFLDLREEIEDDTGKVLSREDFSKIINLNYHKIERLESDNPDIKPKLIEPDTLKAYSDYFGVSIDYLLGYADVRTKNEDIKMIAKYTGLTEESIERLHNMKNVYGAQYGRWISALNAILEDDNIIYILSDLIYPPKSAEAVSQEKKLDEEGISTYPVIPIFDENGEGTLILNPDSAKDNHKQKIAFRLLEVSLWEDLKDLINQLRNKKKGGDNNSKESSLQGKRNRQRNKTKRSQA